MRISLIALSLALGLLGACRQEAPKPARRSAPTPKAAPPAPAPGPRLYDAEGRLRPSETVVGGVPVPLGFTEDPHPRQRRRVFRSREVPIDKAVEYYGPRLFTGEIVRQGAGVTYRGAVPMDDRDHRPSMDVRISPVSGAEVRITLDLHARPPLVAPSVESLEKTLRREQKQIE